MSTHFFTGAQKSQFPMRPPQHVPSSSTKSPSATAPALTVFDIAPSNILRLQAPNVTVYSYLCWCSRAINKISNENGDAQTTASSTTMAGAVLLLPSKFSLPSLQPFSFWKTSFQYSTSSIISRFHQAILSSPCKWRTSIWWFRDQCSPWRGYRDKCASSQWTWHHRSTRREFLFRRWSGHPNTWNLRSCRGRTSPCNEGACCSSLRPSRRCKTPRSSWRCEESHWCRAPSRCDQQVSHRWSCRRRP